MKWLRIILFPIVPIYFLVTKLRNWMYDIGIKSSKSYDFPVICVGNLSVGGTGKTPMIEYLIRFLKDDFKLATLSRGYKRRSGGFVLADGKANASSIGDEPFQIYNKFKDEINVAVDVNRQRGIETLMQKVNPDVVLLDDAFQHRKVNAGLNIILTVYNKLYVEDLLLPTGNLREPISGAKRADVIVVTKCPPNLTEKDKVTISKKLQLLPNQKLFLSSITYSNEVLGTEKLEVTALKSRDVTVVTGIADPTPFVQFLSGEGLSFTHLKFPDHHNFTLKEIKSLEKKEIILTTEKDYVRLKHFHSITEKLYYLPIEFKFDKPNEFEGLVKKFIAN